jgi:hypothetical protein
LGVLFRAEFPRINRRPALIQLAKLSVTQLHFPVVSLAGENGEVDVSVRGVSVNGSDGACQGEILGQEFTHHRECFLRFNLSFK